MTKQDLKKLQSIDITKLTLNQLDDINKKLASVIYSDEYMDKIVGFEIIKGKKIDQFYRDCETLSNKVRMEIFKR
tara:strand:+ start:1957 stop:2181 length:225 start_codon:yes stop_codon:yes gene_type:complete